MSRVGSIDGGRYLWERRWNSDFEKESLWDIERMWRRTWEKTSIDWIAP